MKTAERAPIISRDLEQELFKETYNEQYLPLSVAVQDDVAVSLELVPYGIRKAQEFAREYADSYRGFLVGAFAVAVGSEEGADEMGLFASANYTWHAREADDTGLVIPDPSKICAEQDIILRADHAGFKRLAMIIVAATTNQERIQAVTNVTADTLHPCKACRDIMRANPLVTPNTLIATVGTSGDKLQIQRYASIDRRYRNHAAGEAFEDAPLYQCSSSRRLWRSTRDQYLRSIKEQRPLARDQTARDRVRSKAAIEAVNVHLG